MDNNYYYNNNYNISMQQQASSNNFTALMNGSLPTAATVATSTNNLMNHLYSSLDMGALSTSSVASSTHIKSEPLEPSTTSSLHSLTQNTIQNSYTSSLYSNNNSTFGHSFMNQLNSPADLLDANQVVMPLMQSTNHQNFLNQTAAANQLIVASNTCGSTSPPSTLDNQNPQSFYPQQQQAASSSHSVSSQNSMNFVPPQIEQTFSANSTVNTSSQQLQSPPTTTATSSSFDDEDMDEDEEPEANSKKKKKKSGKSRSSSHGLSVRKHRKNIAFNDIASCFEMPIRDASQLLGVSLTQLKRLCREFQIPRWPFRRLNSIQRRIEVLQIMQQRSESKNDQKSVAQTQQEIDKLQREVVELKTNPSPNVSSILLQDGTVIMNTESPTNTNSFQDQNYANLDARSTTFSNPYTGMLQISNSPQQSFSNMLQMPTTNQYADVDSQKIVLKYPAKNNQQQQQQQQEDIYQSNQTSNFPFQAYGQPTNFATSDTLSMNRAGQIQNFVPSPTPQMIQPNFANNNQPYPTSPRYHGFQTEFHDYSNHFNKSEPNPKIYNFHNITFPSAVNTNLQQMNNLNGLPLTIGPGNTLPPNMTNISMDPLMNVNSINSSVQHDNIQNMNASTNQDNGRLYSRRNAASLDVLTDYEKMQLLNIIAQYNSSMSQSNEQCNPNSPNREEKKNSLIDVLNSRKVSLPADFNAQGVIRKLSQSYGDDIFNIENGTMNFGNTDLDNLTTEDILKLLGDFFPQQHTPVSQTSNK
ncbi:predicted protein [Naegleria gruberi]|uniref:Predicted protein n=1 Tax=Naegleria gruberi TaxID=5762 RepID=D2V4G2_NAEGR|nr:uncharacterized protein NAEGRDRAFT_63714 [Naegleria gruberi]EFC48509.1 predicted protein [Naegleria gruberi]|eukprot:XP_002681253.1 predicted protein [Naegleria gruberi strain NEG-M]